MAVTGPTAVNDSTRSASRFLAGLPSVARTEGGAAHDCEAYNLSRTGVLLIGHLPLPAPASLQLTIRSGAGDLELHTVADVKRVVEDPDQHLHQFGVEFGEMDAERRAVLESLVARVVEGGAPASLEALPANPTTQQVRAALEKVPLPHRIALAQRGQARERELLRLDPNPRVIDALARNPHLTQNDVRAMLRLPHLLPGTVETMGRDGRWRASEALQIQIAAHRNAPFAVAQELVSRMRPDAVRKVLQSPGLNAGVRAKLQAKLPKRL